MKPKKTQKDACCLNRPFDDPSQAPGSAIDYRNPSAIRKMGIDALTKKLGPVGMAYFIRQYDTGTGDYTAEREQLLSDVTMEDIKRYLGETR